MDKSQLRRIQFSLIYLIIAIFGIWLFQSLFFRPMIVRWREVPYSRFRQELESGQVATVTLGRDRIYYTVRTSGDRPSATYNAVRIEDPELLPALLASGVEFRAEPPSNKLWVTLIGWLIPLVPLGFLWYFLFRKLGGGGAGVLSIGKSRARVIAGEMTGLKFTDVGGLEEVEVELREIIAFLKDPSRFTRLGAKLPKGVLLVGPPGTGKTLLAKATAGEAGVPFFSISGSEFVELFVGLGASRVRDLFEQAKAKAPCIVFIDEIDAIGRSRATAGAVVTNDEREQTLNQLLAEMDGFEPNLGVVIMAATNRPEVLDKALLRPGRFDRQIIVPLPTEAGRRQILDIHTRKMVLGPDVNLDRVAQMTAGFSGAELANIANEAALLAVRRNSAFVSMADFELALERVIAGLQRNAPLKGEVRRRVAYHEAGHALVAQLLPHTDTVHKVSIIPTAKGTLGYTMQMPEEDRHLMGEEELKERMAALLGGRAAELLAFKEPSTAAWDDLARATKLARAMVTEFGMAESLGPVRYAENTDSSYLGTEKELRKELGPDTAAMIDREIRRLVEEAQDRALQLLRAKQEALHEIARVLQEQEVISGSEIAKIAAAPQQKDKGVPFP